MQIALFDADPSERTLIVQLLERSGFECRVHDDAKALVADARTRRFDALIVDWKGPASGGAVLGHARAAATRTPTLMMVANGHEDDIIAGLSCGADDYLIKPLRPSELIARLQALLRRAYPNETLERYAFEPYRFDPEPCEVVVTTSSDAEPLRVVLTQKEFDLGLLLFRNAGRPLSRNHIREVVWGGEADISSRTMDTHISRLRSKLGLNTRSVYRVMPVYGYGYRLDRLEP